MLALLLGLTLPASRVPRSLAAGPDHGQVVFIAHRDSGLEDVSALELRNLYLGTSDRLAGRRVNVFHLSMDHPARQLVERVLIGKGSEQLREHWINLRLQGADMAEPRVFRSPQALIAIVSREVAAVAYVPLQSVGSQGVRMLRIDGVSPPSAAAAAPGRLWMLADDR